MNKKGFTLVEVLAAVVILGVISMIGVVSVNQYLKRTKDVVYVDFEKNMISATKNYFIKNSNKIPSLGESIKIDLDLLISEDFSSSLKDPDESGSFCSGYVMVSRKESEGVNVDLNYDACLICSSYESDACNN